MIPPQPSLPRVTARLSCLAACLACALALSTRLQGEPAPTVETSEAPAPSPSISTAPAEAPAPDVSPAPAETAAAVEVPVEASSPPAPLPTEHTIGATPASTAPKPRAKNEVHGLLNLGVSLTDRGDYEAAEIAFRQILATLDVPEVDTQSTLLGLARMHRKKGELTKAAAIYERYLKEWPGDNRAPDALLDLGRTLRAMGVYKLAIERFYNVINSTMKMPAEGFDHYQLLARTAQFEIAETHFQAGEFAEANKFFSRLRLLDLAPSDRARAHFKAAYSLHLSGDNEGAVSTLRTYLDQWPNDENVPEARYLLSISLRALNRSQEAFVATLELLRAEKSRTEVDPKRWAYWQRRTGNQLANDFFESGDILNAHAIYMGLAALSDQPAWRLPITYQIALCYERLGVIDRASQSYQSIVDAVSGNPSADIAELARMAAWRLSHLKWRDNTVTQVNTFFETKTGHDSAPPAASTAPSGSP